MKRIYEQTKIDVPRKSAFDLTHTKLLSMKFGSLVPTMCMEVLPSDQFSIAQELMCRLAPMLAPAYAQLNIFTHFFFVPNRITYPGWEDFITGGVDGLDDTILPQIGINPNNKGTLSDYLGLPSRGTAGPGMAVNALPFYAYNKIFNDYYRDQNVQPDEIELSSQILQQRAFEKDYFTSGLPWPQRGPSVSIPINASFSPQYKSVSTVHAQDGLPLQSGEGNLRRNSNSTNQLESNINPSQDPADYRLAHLQNLVDPQIVDGIQAPIEELRRAKNLQEWLEKNARIGGRYVEQLRARFGVPVQDQRLDRPEYIGGGQQPIVINPTFNTTGTTDSPQGDMTGNGVSVGKSIGGKYTVHEHGYIMAITSVLPRTDYYQGIPKHFLKTDKFDYYNPEFQHLGEQPIEVQEIFFDENDTIEQRQETFAYQQKFAEYKHCSGNNIHGDFRDNLEYWHAARKFSSKPNLNADFIKCRQDDFDRLFAVQDGTDYLWIQAVNSVKARRPMDYFSKPTL